MSNQHVSEQVIVLLGILDRAARVEWSGRFTPAGVSDEQASDLFEGIYRDGLAALRDTLATLA